MTEREIIASCIPLVDGLDERPIIDRTAALNIADNILTALGLHEGGEFVRVPRAELERVANWKKYRSRASFENRTQTELYAERYEMGANDMIDTLCPMISAMLASGGRR